MKLEQSFEVDAPIERVWQTLIDVEHVAPCLPGAAVTGRNEDGSYNGTFTVKIGPTTASYTGKLAMGEVDESAHTATMEAQGTDKRGQGGAKATIFSRLAPVDGAGTRVEVVTDYHITGRLARFGRGGMIEDISEKLLKEFAKRLQDSLSAQPETVATQAVNEPTPESAAAAPDEPAPMASEAASPSPTEVPPPASEAIAPPAQPAPEPADPASGSAAEAAGPEPITPPPPPPPPPVATAPPPPGPGTEAPPAGPATQAPPPPSLENPPEPIQGLSLVGGVLWARVKRNPAPVAAAGGAVMLLLVARRRRRR